jgi:PAS domain S-box-containing protein
VESHADQNAEIQSEPAPPDTPDTTVTPEVPDASVAPAVPARRRVVTRPIVVFAGILLSLVLAGSAALYVEGRRNLRRIVTVAETASDKTPLNNAALARQMESWVGELSLASAAGGAGVLVVMLVGLLLERRRSTRRLQALELDTTAATARLEGTKTEIASQAAARLRLENELDWTRKDYEQRLREQHARLSENVASLQRDLDNRRLAERTMTQQAKELERSKDVLELHVQARTAELQKLQRRNESILNSAGEGIYGLDLQGRTTFANPAAAKLTGWKVEDMLGRTEKELFQTDPAAASGPATAGQNHAAEQTFVCPDGASIVVEYIRTPIREKDREVGAVVIFKDITERKRAEEALNRKAAELARSNAELEQFAYVASHDLQEPLRKIQAFGDRLKAKCDAANLQEGRDFLERMQSAASRMQTLINDLLTFSRVISSSQPLVPVDLGAIVKGVLSDLEVRVEQTKAAVEVGTLPTIEADPMQMQQLFQNLIGNALKFQPPGGQPAIQIQSRLLKSALAGTAEEDPYSEQCEVTVQDNGIGFDEKYLDKVFAVFQRLHGRGEFEGTGVGLAVCRRITDRHGGTITARSKPGEGATFIITLPTRQPAKQELPLAA